MTTAADRIRLNAERVRANQQTVVDAKTSEVPTSEGAEPDSSTDVATTAGETPKQSARQSRRSGQASTSRVEPVFTPRQAPIRRTVDLSPDQHDRLDNWQRQTAREIGRARITGQQVISTLVRRLLEDDDLARTIRDEIYRAP